MKQKINTEKPLLISCGMCEIPNFPNVRCCSKEMYQSMDLGLKLSFLIKFIVRSNSNVFELPFSYASIGSGC